MKTNDGLDELDRGEFINLTTNIIDSLASNQNFSSFAIDGEWGVGKSFVLNMLKEKVDKKKYITIHYNCWENSYYDDPLIAIIVMLLEQLDTVDPTFKSTATYKELIINIASIFNGMMRNSTGIDFTTFTQKKDPLDAAKHLNIGKEISKLKKIILEIAKEKPIILFVDEMDRCLPEYAIKTLERLHLIFDDLKNIIQIIVIDKTQLGNSIKQIFGENIQVDNYLKKFIDFSITLDIGIRNQHLIDNYSFYFDHFDLDSYNKNDAVDFIYTIMNQFDIRTQEKIFKKAVTIHKLLPPNSSTTLMCLEITIISLQQYPEVTLSDIVLGTLEKFNNIKLISILSDLRQKEILDGSGHSHNTPFESSLIGALIFTGLSLSNKKSISDFNIRKQFKDTPTDGSLNFVKQFYKYSQIIK